jgi:hypothetical protein
MTLIDEEILKDMDLAREVLLNEDVTTVITNYGKIWKKKSGENTRVLIELIDEMGEDLKGSVIGNKYLGKASALLCRYAKPGGVYSYQGTKTAIALLIMGNVPCQIEKMVTNTDESFEINKILQNIISPDDAYEILKKKLKFSW